MSGSDDAQICLWDISAATKANKVRGAFAVTQHAHAAQPEGLRVAVSLEQFHCLGECVICR